VMIVSVRAEDESGDGEKRDGSRDREPLHERNPVPRHMRRMPAEA